MTLVTFHSTLVVAIPVRPIGEWQWKINSEPNLLPSVRVVHGIETTINYWNISGKYKGNLLLWNAVKKSFGFKFNARETHCSVLKMSLEDKRSQNIAKYRIFQQEVVRNRTLVPRARPAVSGHSLSAVAFKAGAGTVPKVRPHVGSALLSANLSTWEKDDMGPNNNTAEQPGMPGSMAGRSTSKQKQKKLRLLYCCTMSGSLQAVWLSLTSLILCGLYNSR